VQNLMILLPKSRDFGLHFLKILVHSFKIEVLILVFLVTLIKSTHVPYAFINTFVCSFGYSFNCLPIFSTVCLNTNLNTSIG